MEPDFSPQLIQFSGQQKEAQTAANSRHSLFGPKHQQVQNFWETLPPDSLWREIWSQRLHLLESGFRCRWLEQRIATLKTAFSDLIDCAEDPEQWQSEALQSARQRVLEQFQTLRQDLQSEFLPLLRAHQAEQQVIQALIIAQLNRLDALKLMSAAAFEKAVAASQERRQALSEVGAGVLPEELLTLLKLEELLDAAARYLFAWNRLSTQTPGDKALSAEALSKMQQIALEGLRPRRLPQPPVAPGLELRWQSDKWLNPLGIPVDVYRKTYQHWMKTGLHFVQRALKEKFVRQEPLLQALEAFYAALSVAPERAEAPLALAWLMALQGQPLYALDFLEYALRLEARPEIQLLYQFLQRESVA